MDYEEAVLYVKRWAKPKKRLTYTVREDNGYLKVYFGGANHFPNAFLELPTEVAILERTLYRA